MSFLYEFSIEQANAAGPLSNRTLEQNIKSKIEPVEPYRPHHELTSCVVTNILAIRKDRNNVARKFFEFYTISR